jgi:hypothetical protein
MSHMLTVKYPTVSAATAEQMARDQQGDCPTTGVTGSNA